MHLASATPIRYMLLRIVLAEYFLLQNASMCVEVTVQPEVIITVPDFYFQTDGDARFLLQYLSNFFLLHYFEAFSIVSFSIDVVASRVKYFA